jgi:hypothetical protein
MTAVELAEHGIRLNCGLPRYRSVARVATSGSGRGNPARDEPARVVSAGSAADYPRLRVKEGRRYRRGVCRTASRFGVEKAAGIDILPL